MLFRGLHAVRGGEIQDEVALISSASLSEAGSAANTAMVTETEKRRMFGRSILEIPTTAIANIAIAIGIGLGFQL